MSRLCLLCVHSNDLSPVKPLIIIIIRDTYGQDGTNDTEVIELLRQILIALDSIYTRNQSFPSLNCSLDCGGHSVADRVSALRENSFLH